MRLLSETMDSEHLQALRGLYCTRRSGRVTTEGTKKPAARFKSSHTLVGSEMASRQTYRYARTIGRERRNDLARGL